MTHTLRTLCIGGLALIVVAGTGCARDQGAGRIADLPAYYGTRPAPIQPPRAIVKHWTPKLPSGKRAGWIPPGGISDRWECIVIHHSAGDHDTPRSMRDYHVNVRGWDALGYHFVIGNGVAYGDGQVFVGERWTKQMHGAHCKTPGNYYNEHGIGICLIGNLEKHEPTPKQMEALARLISFLTRKRGIASSKIFTHGGVTNRTACPGRYFSLARILHTLSMRTVSASSQ
ncbi:MAG: peptidoglycan recognition family protein [Phycisphaerae bacterium]